MADGCNSVPFFCACRLLLGCGGFQGQTSKLLGASWTPFQKNNQLISISGYFLWNRIVWLCFSVLLLVITFRLFSFRKGVHEKCDGLSNTAIHL